MYFCSLHILAASHSLTLSLWGDSNALGHAVTFHRAKLPGPAIIRLHAGLGEHRVGTRLNTIVDLISESVGDRQRAKQLPVRDKTVNITQREKTWMKWGIKQNKAKTSHKSHNKLTRIYYKVTALCVMKLNIIAVHLKLEYECLSLHFFISSAREIQNLRIKKLYCQFGCMMGKLIEFHLKMHINKTQNKLKTLWKGII